MKCRATKMQLSAGVIVRAIAVILALQVPGQAAPPRGAPSVLDPLPNSYPLTALKIAYDQPRKDLPAIDDLMKAEVELSIDRGCYVAPKAKGPTVKMKLGELGKGNVQRIDAGGIGVVYQRTVVFLNDQHLAGVFVAVDPADIDANDKDIRKGRTDLSLRIVYSVVADVRTVWMAANGEQVANRPEDAAVRKNSPIKPQADGGPNLLNRKMLDDYVAELNKTPGRKVEVAIVGGGAPGKVILQYVISPDAPQADRGER